MLRRRPERGSTSVALAFAVFLVLMTVSNCLHFLGENLVVPAGDHGFRP